MEEAAEDSRQRAIRCTQEVVEREESRKREEELSIAREEWKREKQQFFQDAHQNQLRAIARQTAILEEKLKKDFKDHLEQLEHKHGEDLERTVQETWGEAEVVKGRAVSKARSEEQHLADEKAKRVASRVCQEKKREREQAESDKASALQELTRHMQAECGERLAEQQRELDRQHTTRLTEISGEYKERLAELERRLGEEEAENERLRTDLHEMTESRDSWELRYKNLKMEFADFIDQFPGFRAEFILK